MISLILIILVATIWILSKIGDLANSAKDGIGDPIARAKAAQRRMDTSVDWVQTQGRNVKRRITLPDENRERRVQASKKAS